MNDAPDIGTVLLRIARAAIGEKLGCGAPLPTPTHTLHQHGATFVTLFHGGELRGCIGTVSAWRPLGEDVRANAVAAAFMDPRFTPLTRNEYPGLAVEVSLLDAPRPMFFVDEADVLSQLRPGVDGVVLEAGRHRSTFLPQVWEQLPDMRAFLGALKRKAGLPERYWGSEMRLSRYEVRKFVEETVLP
jgi:AmmeMemoRadiSam system protein A